MSFNTPASERCQQELKDKWPDIKFGIYNRRPIAGTTTWSQHSWPNAIDIFFTQYGDTSPGHSARLSEVATWLREQADRLDIRTLLWGTVRHEDHIHADFWPKGYGTPSLHRGGEDNLYKTQAGDILTQAELVQEGRESMQKGDSGPRVKLVQERLLKLGYELPVYGADGDFGPEMEAAVVAWQEAMELDPDGVLQALDIEIMFSSAKIARVALLRTKLLRKDLNDLLDKLRSV